MHEFQDEFKILISIVAKHMHLPESAIERDYYIVLLLNRLSESEYAEQCVFKGGTSLSKCYPGTIERFSEDIDLTFLGIDKSDGFCDKTIKRIEKLMICDALAEKIPEERFPRSKAMFVWFRSELDKIKLEIGSSIRPDPYSKKELKSYIQEYLEMNDGQDDIERFELKSISLNVLNIERTFVDKLMAVKRHAICGNLVNKVRHIYDVTKMYSLPFIQTFLSNEEELKRLVKLTKETDSFYLNKRNDNPDYNPIEPYSFPSWEHHFTKDIKRIYENLHKDLLYTDEKQDFELAKNTFKEINDILKSIGE